MVVVLVFVICNCLAMVSNILELFEVCAVSLTLVSNFLVTLNSSVNLFIYCAFGERFRNEIKRLAKHIRRKVTICCCINYNVNSKDISLVKKNLSTKRSFLHAKLRKAKSLPDIAPGTKNVNGIGTACKYISEAPSEYIIHEL